MADSNIIPDPAPLAEEAEEALLHRVQRVFGAVFFQILIAPRETQSSGETIKIIEIQNNKNRRNIDKNSDKNIQIETIRFNYKQLVKKARETLAKVKAEYKEKDFEVVLLRRKDDSKTDHHTQSDSDQESEAESELKVNTDTDSESDAEWELKTEPEQEADKELSVDDLDYPAGKRLCKWKDHRNASKDEYDDDECQEE